MARDFNFDLTEEDFKDNGFAPVPEGRYDVEIVEAEFRTSKNKGTPSYNFKLKSLDESFKGFLFFDMWITPKTIGTAVKRIVKAVDLTPVPSVGNASIPDPDEFVGREINVKVTHEDRKDSDGELVKDDDGNQIVDARVDFFSVKAAGEGGASTKSSGGGFDL